MKRTQTKKKMKTHKVKIHGKRIQLRKNHIAQKNQKIQKWKKITQDFHKARSICTHMMMNLDLILMTVDLKSLL